MQTIPLYLVLDLIDNDEGNSAFVRLIFPYERGDVLAKFDLAEARAIIRIAQGVASEEQRECLHTSKNIVGFCCKERDQIAHLLDGTVEISRQASHT